MSNTTNHSWLRLYHDFLKDEKIIALAFEDQRHFIGILILKSEGTLDKNVDENLLDRIVAQNLWIDHAIIRDVKKRLVDTGLINCSWQPLGWDNRQYPSDKDATNAKRQKEYRERKKAEKEAKDKKDGVVTENAQSEELEEQNISLSQEENDSNVTSNVTVTDTEKKREEEKRRDNKTKGKNKNTKTYFKHLVEDIESSVPRKTKVSFTEKAFKAYLLIKDKSQIKENYIKHQELKEQFSQTIANFLIDYETNIKDLQTAKPKDTFNLGDKKYDEKDKF